MNSNSDLVRIDSLARIDAAPLALVEILPADENPAAVYLASLSSTASRRSMKTALNLIAAIVTSGRCDAFSICWGALRFQHTAAIRAALAERYAPSSANHRMAALRGVLKAAWNLGQIPTEEYHRAINLTTVRGETLPRGRALSAGELRVLFAGCGDGKNAGVRDQALLAVLYGCGLRRSEAVALDVGDYDADEDTLRILVGKGKKQRLVHLPPGAKQALDRWIWLREETLGTQESVQQIVEEMVAAEGKLIDESGADLSEILAENGADEGANSEADSGEMHSAIYKDRERGFSGGKEGAETPFAAPSPTPSPALSSTRSPLFVPILKSSNPTGGRMILRRLTDQSVLTILTSRAKQVGLKKTSPHDFRRTFISDLLEAGADIATVQKMAGHANVTTTARYDRRDEKTRKKAANLLHVPVE